MKTFYLCTASNPSSLVNYILRVSRYRLSLLSVVAHEGCPSFLEPCPSCFVDCLMLRPDTYIASGPVELILGTFTTDEYLYTLVTDDLTLDQPAY